MARTLRSSATHSKSLLVFQMPTPQLRHFAKDLLQLVLPSEMLLRASRGCQVDDLKEAVCSEAVHSTFCLTPCHSILCPATQMKSTSLQGIKNKAELSIPSFKMDIYSQKESFACSRAPVSFPTPHPLPCLSWTLQDGGWVKDVEDSAVDRGKSRPSTWFRCLSTLGWCRRPAVRADCYGFMLPAGAAGAT